MTSNGRGRREEASQGHAAHEPIAIIGMGCRFPGADTLTAFWQMLAGGVDAIGEMPPDRFDVDAVYDPRPGTPGKIVTRQGGFLRDIDRFDPQFFGISPREAAFIDPQQRLLLEVAWHTFEDAGIPRDRFAGTRTGVFVGMWTSEYADRMSESAGDVDLYVTTGGGRYAASGRLSFVFDLQGPSLTLDTACSSSLVAVHLACRSLAAGESTMALAGGVNLILHPHISIGYSRSKMLSPEARCKFGDAGANGYVRSEGLGLVLLKPLGRALEDGDRIHAVILGAAVNNDGRGNGILVAPSVDGQQAMLRQAYRTAGVSPASVQYVEAHGTGTRVGDPIELGALGAVLGEGRDANRPCLIGSIKTNIGHTEAASGIAGLIKVVLAMQRREIPPSLHMREPNPSIPWDDLALRMVGTSQPWPATEGGPVLAGVNSFGVTGTNAHVVLRAFQPEAAERQPESPSSVRACVLPVSSHTAETVRRLAADYADLLDGHDDLPLDDLCLSAGARRTHHSHRLAVVGEDRSALAQELRAFASGVRTPVESNGLPRRIAFVFPGQGSQWIGMGRRLLDAEPVFRHALEECDAAIREHNGWSVIGELQRNEPSSRLSEIDVIQPALFSMQVALAAMWRSWGIEPEAVVGHSMGEVAAAYVAGALTLQDAVRVICRRSSLLRRTSGQGGMAVVELSLRDAARALAGFEHVLSVAVSNSRRSTVISGETSALDALIARLEARDVFCRRIKVDVASHSPQMDPLRDELARSLEGLAPRAATVPMYSTVTATRHDGAGCEASYWVDNLRKPVLFSTSIQQLLRDGYTTFIELSPHPILMPAVQEEMQEASVEGLAVHSLHREEDEHVTILRALGAVYASGHTVNWSAVYPGRHRLACLPQYQFLAERFWFETGSGAGGHQASRRRDGHPLLGEPIAMADRPDAKAWQTEFRTADTPWLLDCRVHGLPVIPASAYLEMAWAACARFLGTEWVRLSAITFERAVFVNEESASVRLQIVIRPSDGAVEFEIHSEAGNRWTRHVIGHGAPIRSTDADAFLPVPDVVSDPTSSTEQGRGEFYGTLARKGLTIGPSLQSVVSVRAGSDVVHVTVRAQDAFVGRREEYYIEPSLLDGIMQATAVCSYGREDRLLRMPAFIREVVISGRAAAALDARMTWSADAVDGPVLNATFAGADGRAVGSISGIVMKEIAEAAAAPQSLERSIFHTQWHEAPRAAPERRSATGRWLLVTDHQGAGAALSEALTAAGGECVVVEGGGNQVESLAGSEAIRAVVYLRGLDVEIGAGLHSHDAGLHLVTDVLAAARTVAGRPPARLWIVTRGVQKVVEADALDGVSQSPVWGLGRVIGEEYPDALGGLVDLDPAEPGSAGAAQLADELMAAVEGDQIALRQGRRYVARLAPLNPLVARAHVVRPDAAYLVTGGLGNLGLRVAQWLVACGARRLILAGRTPLPPRREWTRLESTHPSYVRVQGVRALEAAGASVHLAAIDVANVEDVRTWLAAYQEEGWPQVRGVVHCAGVLVPKLLSDLTPESVDAVMRPKVLGAVVLDALLAEAPLDFFLLFSSVASQLPTAGQANYAAANAFLDAFSAYRQARGKPALSLNWGPLSGIGMAADRDDDMVSRGIGPVSLGLAEDAFRHLLAASVDHVVVTPFDPARWRDRVPSAISAAFVAALPTERTSAPAASTADAASASWLDRLLREKTGADRRDLLETLLRVEAGTVLKASPDRVNPVKPLRTMGLDSLTGLELRNRLERATNLKLPATLVWNYSTIVALGAHLAERMGVALDDALPESEAAEDGAAADADFESLLDEIGGLSDQEAQRLLAEGI